MKKKKMWFLVIFATLFICTSIYASSMKELEAEKKAIAEAFEKTQTRLLESEKELLTIHDHIKDMEMEILDMKYHVEGIEVALKEKRVEVENIKLDLQDVQQNKVILFQQARERIKVLYEYGDTSYLEMLFDSKDMVDLYNRLEYVNKLVAFDLDLFKRLENFEKDVMAQKAELEIQETELVNLAIEATKEEKALEDKVLAKSMEINDLIEDQALYEDMIKAFEEDEKRIDEEIDEMIRLSKLVYIGGKMRWPVPGWYNLSSPFGNRFHPVHKKWKFHNGIDIPAYSGTPIVAAAKGNVLISRYSSSFGNYILIDHGSGYATIYGHCSKLLVKVGDSVDGGEIIGKVGTTGWSTGNHLHFGVKLNGEWVNPMDYVK